MLSRSPVTPTARSRTTVILTTAACGFYMIYLYSLLIHDVCIYRVSRTLSAVSAGCRFTTLLLCLQICIIVLF